MFYKIYNDPRDLHINRKTDIHEHRAPTDESVKLLSEMQSEARKSIIKSVVVNDNKLSLTYVIFSPDPMFRQKILMIKFLLNGKEHIITEVIKEVEYRFEDDKTVFEKIVKYITDEIVNQLRTDLAIEYIEKFKRS